MVNKLVRSDADFENTKESSVDPNDMEPHCYISFNAIFLM